VTLTLAVIDRNVGRMVDVTKGGVGSGSGVLLSVG